MVKAPAGLCKASLSTKEGQSMSEGKDHVHRQVSCPTLANQGRAGTLRDSNHQPLLQGGCTSLDQPHDTLC